MFRVRERDSGSLSAIADIKIPSATSKRQQPWRNRSVILSLWIWCALLSFPLFAVDAIEATTNQMLIYQTTGLLQFVIVTLAVVPGRAASAVMRHTPFQTTIVLVILLSLALQIHGPEASILEGIAYTLALLVAIACLSAVWSLPQDALAICFGGIAVILATFGICAIAALGWPEGRVVGNIHPNAFGSIMLMGFMLSQFREGLVMLGLRVTCLILAAAVSSRFAVIGCFLAFLVFELSFRPLSLRLALLVLAAAACLLLFPRLLTDLLALDDPTRNLDSGFTGREDLWNLALAAVADAPFGLGFKRPPVEIAGHNGYLRWLVEFGVLGGGLIIVSTVSTIAVALIEASLVAAADNRLRRFASARAAGLVALAFASFFQPQMFNLGDMHGLAIMLMLFSPRIGPKQRIPV
jgi:O-antigen ligase